MAVDREEKHIFYSSGAARVFSAITGSDAQGVTDLIKEMSFSVNVKMLSEKESYAALLRSGTPIEDLLTLKNIQNFLRVTGETSKVHRIVAGDSSEKKIERFSEIVLKYYKHISELGKSEPEDFSEFMNLFPLKYNLSSDYVSHLPSFIKPYHGLFTRQASKSKLNERMTKKKFSDYFSEFRWIARDILGKEGIKCVAAPDDYSAVGIAKELELYGIKTNLISQVPAVLISDSPYNFILSALRCIDQDLSYESVLSLIENPFCGIEATKIVQIKKESYDKNITRGLRDWKTLFQDLKINTNILDDLEFLSKEIGNGSGLEELAHFSDRYLGESNYPRKMIDLISISFPDYFSDALGIMNDLESIKYLPKVNGSGDSQVIVGRPVDLLGLNCDTLYIIGQDSATSFRSFPEDARDLMTKIGLEGAHDSFMEGVYKELIASSKNVYLTYSALDDRLSYSESTAFYDSLGGREDHVSRDEVFIPYTALSEWEISKENGNIERYSLESDLVKSRIEKPIYPTFIENYIGCHFKGFVNGFLGIDEIDAPREFLDPRTTGTLTHRILEKYYSTDISPTNFSKLAEAYIRSEINRERYESRIEALRFYREKYLSSGRLTRFFIMDVNHAFELGRKTIQKEFHFPTKDQQVPYTFDDKAINIGGFVDRVDEENGSLCIIDYKSSLYGYPKNDLCDPYHGKIQLFLYKIGVETIFKKKVSAAAYVSFKDISEGFSTAGFYHTIPNEEAQVRKCREIVDPALNEFMQGDCDPVVKDGGSLWNCENALFCSLLSVCRAQERRW